MAEGSLDSLRALAGVPPPQATDVLKVPPSAPGLEAFPPDAMQLGDGTIIQKGTGKVYRRGTGARPEEGISGVIDTPLPSSNPNVDINSAEGPPLDDKASVKPAIGGRAAGPAKPPAAVERPPRDRSALDNVFGGVLQIESGDQHFDDKGRVKVNPKSGATGAAQIIPSTAEYLGIDRFDEAQNREGGKRYLAEQYDKYGNWDDALAAYNWGPGNVDKWIAAGRDVSKMPAETRSYISTVLNSTGVEPTSEVAVTKAKRAGTLDDLRDETTNAGAPRNLPPATIEMSDAELLRQRDSDAAQGGLTDAAPAAIEAFGQGVRRGVQNLALGPVQAALEGIAPETASELTRRVNEFEDQFEAPKQHPNLAFMGNVVGTTVGLLAAGKLLGATPLPGAIKAIMPQFLSRAGLITRGTAGGIVMGLTEYNASPEESSRLLEGVLGGSVGALGGLIARWVVAGARQLASTNTYNQFLTTVKNAVGDLGASTTKLKDTFLNHYESLVQTKNEKYTIRDAAGRELGDGLPRAEVGKPAMDSMTASRERGVAPTATTRATATQVDRELGGPEARALEAEHAALEKQYEKDLQEWTKAANKVAPSNMAAGARAQILRQAEDAGIIPQAPVHPGEFEQPPITPEQFATALQAVNRAWSRTSTKDPTTRTQLRMMAGEMTQAAERAASEAGMDLNTYLRSAEDASKFYRENIAPIQRQFAGQSPAQLRGDPAVPFSGMSPAKFFDYATNILKSNDREAVRSLAKIMGPESKDELVKIAAYDMLTKIEKADGDQGPRVFSQYIKDHAENLQDLLGRERVTELQGLAKIAEQMVGEPTKYGQLHRLLASHGWLQAIGAVKVAEGVFHGDIRRVGQGAGMILGPWVGHHLYEVGSKLHDNIGVLPLVKRAASQRPGSVELDRTLSAIEAKVMRNARVTARVLAPAANVGAPLVP